MSGLQLAIIGTCGGGLAGMIFGRCIELFGKGGLQDLRRKLKASEEENARLFGLLIERAHAEFSSEGAGEDERESVEQSSVRPLSPADELRKAIQIERDEWDDHLAHSVFPNATKVHLALAELLAHIADDMSDEDAKECTRIRGDGSTYKTVHPFNHIGDVQAPRYDWSAALECARAITGGSDK